MNETGSEEAADGESQRMCRRVTTMLLNMSN